MIDRFKEKIFEEMYQKTDNIDDLLNLMEKSKEFININAEIATKLLKISINSEFEDNKKIKNYLLKNTSDKIFQKVMDICMKRGI